jgi:hypothetical protein
MFNFCFLSNCSISTCTTSKRGRTGAAVWLRRTTFCFLLETERDPLQLLGAMSNDENACAPSIQGSMLYLMLLCTKGISLG